MSPGIELVYPWDQRILTTEWVQTHDQRSRCKVQCPGTLEKVPSHRPYMAAVVVFRQLHRHISHGVVDQRRQPADHLHPATLPARSVGIRTLLVVAARHPIQHLVMDSYSVRLFVVL